jgi:hypothetical protein
MTPPSHRSDGIESARVIHHMLDMLGYPQAANLIPDPNTFTCGLRWKIGANSATNGGESRFLPRDFSARYEQIAAAISAHLFGRLVVSKIGVGIEEPRWGCA